CSGDVHEGIRECCVCIGMGARGKQVGGGIYNPACNETFLGSIGLGLTYNRQPAHASQRNKLEGALVLASRSETKRGEWKEFESAPFKILPMGSVAYKLARVAAGPACLTFYLISQPAMAGAGGTAI